MMDFHKALKESTDLGQLEDSKTGEIPGGERELPGKHSEIDKEIDGTVSERGRYETSGGMGYEYMEGHNYKDAPDSLTFHDTAENRPPEYPEIADMDILNIRTEEVFAGRAEGTFLGRAEGIIPKNGGTWTGEAGNSTWEPDPEIEPGDRNGTNPEHKKWKEILSEYNIDGIPFNNGEPDFSEVAKATVEIDDFSDDRSYNFDQADEKLAEEKGCTPEEVAAWRKEHGYTWHECSDCKTMQKVPTEIHGNISHSGGISVYKESQKNS